MLWGRPSSDSSFHCYNECNTRQKPKHNSFFFFNQLLSLLRGWQKLPRLTVFQVIPAGYWVKFSTSNDHASDKPHRLRYCLCERMPEKVATSSVHLSAHGTTGWYQALNYHSISILALMDEWCVYETGKRCAQKGLFLVLSSLKEKKCAVSLNLRGRELWVSWQQRAGVIILNLQEHVWVRDRFNEPPTRLGRIMKSARTLQTYSEGGPMPALLPFSRLWRSP